jgi:glycosyltransferase involved in cell wall biosynthesis
MPNGEASRLCVTGLRGIPGVMGGVETHCEELLPRLAANAPDLQIEVLGRRPYVGDQPHRCHRVNVTPLPAPRDSHLEAIVSTAIAVIYAKQRRARALHIHAIGPAILAPLARALGLKVVMTHHGDDYNRAKWGRFAKLVLRTGERWGLACSHRVIAVSPSLAFSLARRYPAYAKKLRYIPNGAPSLRGGRVVTGDVLSRFGIAAGEFILAVGRLVPEKGFDYLIKAFRKSGTKRKLVIAGASDHDSPFAQEIMNEADEQVVLVGQQSRQVLKVLYENAGLFVLPSLHEGLPIAALEAGRLATPTLLSDIRPNRDVGYSEEHYFPAGDTNALAEKLSRPSREFAVDPREIESRFDWDEIAQNTLAVYQELELV